LRSSSEHLNVHTAAMHHEASHAWFDAALAGTEVIGLPWLSLIAFVRIATNPRATRTPLSASDAPAERESRVPGYAARQAPRAAAETA